MAQSDSNLEAAVAILDISIVLCKSRPQPRYDCAKILVLIADKHGQEVTGSETM